MFHLFLRCLPFLGEEVGSEASTCHASCPKSPSGLFLQVPVCSRTRHARLECHMNFHQGNTYVDLSFPREESDQHHEISLDFLPHHQYPRPILAVASCGGLVLCSGLMHVSSCYHYYVCNPVTKQWVVLPQPPIDHRPTVDDSENFYFGIICDPPCSEYNVTLFSAQWEKDKWRSLNVVTFSSLTGQWKQSTVDLPKPLADTPYNFNGVSCKGILYWLVESCDVVVAYNPSSVECQLLELPSRIVAREGEGFLEQSGGLIWFVDITGEAQHPHLTTWVLETDSGNRKTQWCLGQTVAWRELIANSPEWAKENGSGFEDFVAKNPVVGAPSHDAVFWVVALHPVYPNIVFLRMWGGYVTCDLQSKMLEELYRCREHWNLLNDSITPYLPSPTRISRPSWAPPCNYQCIPFRV